MTTKKQAKKKMNGKKKAKIGRPLGSRTSDIDWVTRSIAFEGQVQLDYIDEAADVAGLTRSMFMRKAALSLAKRTLGA